MAAGSVKSSCPPQFLAASATIRPPPQGTLPGCSSVLVPIAMNSVSSKRKFNSLLNSLGSKSTASLGSTSPEQDAGSTAHGPTVNADRLLQAKRRRILAPASLLNKSMSRPSYSAPASKTSAASKEGTATSTENHTSETPKFVPWDRAEFLKRLSTFSNVVHWTPKPDEVNEVAWAKRGWVRLPILLGKHKD